MCRLSSPTHAPLPRGLRRPHAHVYMPFVHLASDSLDWHNSHMPFVHLASDSLDWHDSHMPFVRLAPYSLDWHDSLHIALVRLAPSCASAAHVRVVCLCLCVCAACACALPSRPSRPVPSRPIPSRPCACACAARLLARMLVSLACSPVPCLCRARAAPVHACTGMPLWSHGWHKSSSRSLVRGPPIA